MKLTEWEENNFSSFTSDLGFIQDLQKIQKNRKPWTKKKEFK